MPRRDNDPVDDLAKKLLSVLEVELLQAGNDMVTEAGKVFGDSCRLHSSFCIGGYEDSFTEGNPRGTDTNALGSSRKLRLGWT